MRARMFLAFALALGTLAATFAPAGAEAPKAPLQRFIVGFAGDGLPADLDQRLTSLGITEAVGFETINAVAVTAPAAAIRDLVDDADVVAARQERQLELHLARSVPYIDADEATVGRADRFQRNGRTYIRGAVDGSGSTVAVLDTGINDSHPDLVDRVVAHRNFELSYVGDLLLTGQQLDTYAEATGESARTDDIGHGTHVAGIVAGTGFAAQNRRNNNQGVAPGAKLVDLRIAAGPVQGLVEDMGWERNAIAAFDWLVRNRNRKAYGANGIQLSTNSWGLTGADVVYGAPSYDPLREIIELMNERGLHTVFSAGNDGPEDNVQNHTVPNGLREVISVAASCKPGAIQEKCDKPASVNDIGAFSSRGPAVDIAAPGVEIVSTVSPNVVGALAKACLPSEFGDEVPCAFYRGSYGGKDASEGDVAANYALYGSLHGTSMAGPHVAGVVALLLQNNPGLSPRQVQVILAATAKDRQRPGRDISSGWGLVDVDRALRAATLEKRGSSLHEVFPAFDWAPSL